MRKAFEIVDHSLLIMKLRSYGFSESTSYLITLMADHSLFK